MSKPIETVIAIYTAFGNGDIPAILGHLADDVEWEHDAVDHGVPILKPRRGKAAVTGFFESLAAIRMERFEPQSFLEGKNQVVATIQVKWTHVKTGRTFSDLELHLWTFDDRGKVARFRHYLDTHGVFLAFQ